MLIIFLNKVHFFNFCCIIHKDVGVKMYFAPSDTELLRALHSRNSIFINKLPSATKESFYDITANAIFYWCC